MKDIIPISLLNGQSEEFNKELLKKCKVYKQIALSQLTKEELENA